MTDQQQQLQMVMHLWAAMFPVILLVWSIKIALYVIPMWRIAKRAGLSPGIALLCAVPLIGRMLTMYVVAFSEWRTGPAAFPYMGGYPAPPPQAYPPQSYPPPAYPPRPTMAAHGYAAVPVEAPPTATPPAPPADDTDVPSAS